MSLFKKKPFLMAGLFLLGVVGIPLTIFLFQQQQEIRSRADKTVVFSFEPTSSQTTPLAIPAGSTFSLDVFVDPGPSSVSFVKAEMLYDTSKFELAGGFIPNTAAFPQVVETPVNTPGKVTATLSIGSDLTKALTTKTKIGTLTLKALSSVPANTISSITFGSGSQALAVSSNATFNENVLANTIPAFIQMNQQAATCGNAPNDAMLIIDRSGSMNETAGSSGTKLASAKVAANNFIDIVSKDAQTTMGLTTFATTSTLDSPLSSDPNATKTKINAIVASGNTCIECGINKANQEITTKKRTGIKNVVVLLTDGLANVIDGSTSTVSTSIAEQKALDAAKAGNTTNGTIYYTIGLGTNVNSAFLTKLAESTGGQYYFSPTTDQLNTIYTQISQIIAKSSVNGSVFNDVNGNGVFDTTEAKLSGWTVQLTKVGSSVGQSITTDSTGNFSFTNLCDGSYTLKQTVQTGWKQTLPPSAGNYSFSLSNGNAVTGKDFGNKKATRCSDGIDNDNNGFIDDKDSTCHTDGNPQNPNSYDPEKDGEHGGNTCADSKDNNGNGVIDGADPICHTDGNPGNPGSYDPNRPEVNPTATPTITPLPTHTPTPAPTATNAPTPTKTPQGATLSLTMLLHGIGSGGDNANPTQSSLSNKNPLTKQRPTSVTIFNSNNVQVATGSGFVSYDSASGSFKGTITTVEPVVPGQYSIKVRTNYHLTRLVPGIQNIELNKTYEVQTIQIVAGDANNDNKLNILDYNMLLDCYSDLEAPVACDANKKIATDANDDGNVNQFDYNLFLREISTQPGE